MQKVVLVALSLLAVTLSQAGVLTVCSRGCDHTSIQQAVHGADPGDTIELGPETFFENVFVYKDLTIRGAGPDRTVVDGAFQGQVFASGNVDLNLADMTIQGGQAPSFGGGGVDNEGRLSLENCVVRNNQGTGGEWSVGGVFAFEAVITTTEIRDNTADWTGGIFSNDLRMTNSAVQDNWPIGIRFVYGRRLAINTTTISGNWAAISSFDTDRIEIEDSTISRNHFGIGASPNVRSVVITRSTVSENADVGAWLVGNVVLDNTTVARNGSHGLTIGIGGSLKPAQIVNSTLVDNAGSGIRAGEGTSLTTRNSIIANNGESDCSGESDNILSGGHNLSSDASCGFSMPGDIENIDPMLGPLQDNGGPTRTYRPIRGSPVIDAGWCDPGVDQRGIPRPLDGNHDSVPICDIGAVEYVPYEFEIIGPGGDVIVVPPDGE